MDNFKKRPWYRLNVNTHDAINSNFDFNNYGDIFELQEGIPEKAAYWLVENHNIRKFLSPTWIDKFETFGYKLDYALVFYKNLVSESVCHIDYDKKTNQPSVYALNWCPKFEDADMVWYKKIEFEKELTTAPGRTKYMAYSLSEIDSTVIHRCNIGDILTLVNTELPHEIEMNKTDRWCISLRLRNTVPIYNWSDAVEYFKPLINN